MPCDDVEGPDDVVAFMALFFFGVRNETKDDDAEALGFDFGGFGESKVGAVLGSSVRSKAIVNASVRFSENRRP